MMVKVSVLVPVYNVEGYLRKCLDSIVGQTLKEIQIICIDDGSTDGSGDILDFYAAQDSRIVVVHKGNTGYGNSMNIALEMATGEYIGIVESDDYILPDMYEKLYMLAKEKELDCLKTNYYGCMEGKIILMHAVDNFECDRVIDCTESLNKFDNNAINIWAGIYRRDFLESNCIRFRETPGASFQDVSFWFKVYVSAERCLFDNDAFYVYRMDNAASSVKSREKVYSICGEIKECKAYLDTQKKIYDAIFPYWLKLLLDSYLWNVKRIGEEYVAEFVQYAAEELEEYWKDNASCIGVLTQEEWVEWVLWINSPDFFCDREYDRRIGVNCMAEKEKIVEIGFANYVKTQTHINIYGAGKVGHRLERWIRRINADCSISFLVTDFSAEGTAQLRSKADEEVDIEKPIVLAVNKKVDRVQMQECAKKAGFERIVDLNEQLQRILIQSE